MKILLITDTHTTDGGGAEKYFFTLKKLLQERGDLTVHSLGFGAQQEQAPNSTVLTETPSKLLRQFWRMFFNPSKYFEIKKAIEEIKPDLIHLHNVKKYTISLLTAIQDYPVVQTVHDYSPICPTGWNVHENLEPCETGLSAKCFWRHKRQYGGAAYLALLFSFFRMNKLLKKHVKKFISPSPLLEHYLRLNHFGATIYLPPFRNENASTAFTKIRADHFLYIGQLETQKGVEVLIQEFALACEKNNALILKIAGTGSQAEALKQTVKELNLDKNIFFLGWVNDTEQLYRESLALIFPSIGLESFGLVITEAMSYARPVIGSDRGPTKWLVDNEETGLLFDPLAKGDLAEKILRLADNKKLAEKFGQQALSKLNAFLTDENIIDKMLTVYSTIL